MESPLSSGPVSFENMARQNTRLESEGAEFLVLGNLLILGIPAYKSYSNMAGYDLVAINPDQNSSVRIQVKSRWRTGAEGFIIKNFDCDFVVVVLLNRGSACGKKEIKSPEFHILPVAVIKDLQTAGWGKLALSKIPAFKEYKDRWDLISDSLKNIETRHVPS